jgi:hypothetical protein
MGGDACPYFTGTYVVSGATLRLRARINNNLQIRCPQPGGMLTWEYVNALGLVETYRLEEGRLVLASAGGRLQLTFKENPCDTTGSSSAHVAPAALFSGTPPPATPCPLP